MELDKSRSKKGLVFAILGFVCMLIPVATIVVAIIRMWETSDTLGQTGADVEALAAHIRELILQVTVGVGGGLLGLGFLCVALFGYRYRAPWFFIGLCLLSAVLLGGFPVGTVLGGLLIWFCIAKKEEFFPERTILETKSTTGVS